MYFFDTESCGLLGPVVLIQYAEDDGSVHMVNVWRQPIRDTLELIERLCDGTLCGFNLTHDMFHFNKLYNLFYACKNQKHTPRIEEIVSLHKNPPRTYCIKPKRALDLWLYARKGPYQTLMDRKDIRIKRIPQPAAQAMAQLLTKAIVFDNIYFSRRANGYQWVVETCDDARFCDLVLKFGASSALKPLVSEIFKCDVQDYPIPKYFYPQEDSFDPYDTRWEDKLRLHIMYWEENKQARSYAENDVIYLQRLYRHWGEPTAGDDDSELACAVGAARWSGFAVDAEGIKREILRLKKSLIDPPVNFNSPKQVLYYLRENASAVERLAINDTSKETLILIREWPSEVGKIAGTILEYRSTIRQIDTLNKLRTVGRFCPDFRIIGARSGRMSGGSELKKGGSLNPQGIQRGVNIRKFFILADEGEILSGGDFVSFEVTLADAAYNDSNLRSDLESGRNIHALFGEALYELPYDQIMASKRMGHNYYNPAKNSFFGLIYGAHHQRIATVAGIDEAQAESAYNEFIKRYPKIAVSRKVVFDAFCSMRQPAGLGTIVEWHAPADYIESLLGFRRYFTLENRITECLFKLAQDPPHILEQYVGEVIRRERKQTVKGAVRSALYATAFQIQASNMRAAANHVIQSTGAQICKHLQRRIWDIQPSGVHPWYVKTLNVHDEVMVVHTPGLDIKPIVEDVVNMFKETVPLLKIDWKHGLKNWAEK